MSSAVESKIEVEPYEPTDLDKWAYERIKYMLKPVVNPDDFKFDPHQQVSIGMYCKPDDIKETKKKQSED